MTSEKRQKGQFYTTLKNYILEDLPLPGNSPSYILEPFAGKGHLLDWIKDKIPNYSIRAYDIQPLRDDIIERDTLLNPPDYEDSWVITNPPYLARNKSKDKRIFDQYMTNDLYKCFIVSLLNSGRCKGGILIIPAGFFLSPRENDFRIRDSFLSKYKLLKVKYFEESVFPDTKTTVVAFSFEISESNLVSQDVGWKRCPHMETKIFTSNKSNNWIIGGEIYKLKNGKIRIKRYIEGYLLKEDEYLTNLTLNALDSGKKAGRISLSYRERYVYPAKDSSRTYATLITCGRKLSATEQIDLSNHFNNFIEDKRSKTWSLFLPQYRESKEYARKRIPFDLAYKIISYLLEENFS